MVFLLGPGDCCGDLDCLILCDDIMPQELEVAIPSDWTPNSPCNQAECDVSVDTFILNATEDPNILHLCGCGWALGLEGAGECTYDRLSACITQFSPTDIRLVVFLLGVNTGLPAVFRWEKALPIVSGEVDCTFGGVAQTVPFIDQTASANCVWGGSSVIVTAL